MFGNRRSHTANYRDGPPGGLVGSYWVGQVLFAIAHRYAMLTFWIGF